MIKHIDHNARFIVQIHIFNAADTSKPMFCENRLNFFKLHYTLIKDVHSYLPC